MNRNGIHYCLRMKVFVWDFFFSCVCVCGVPEVRRAWITCSFRSLFRERFVFGVFYCYSCVCICHMCGGAWGGESWSFKPWNVGARITLVLMKKRKCPYAPIIFPTLYIHVRAYVCVCKKNNTNRLKCLELVATKINIWKINLNGA